MEGGVGLDTGGAEGATRVSGVCDLYRARRVKKREGNGKGTHISGPFRAAVDSSNC